MKITNSRFIALMTCISMGFCPAVWGMEQLGICPILVELASKEWQRIEEAERNIKQSNELFVTQQIKITLVTGSSMEKKIPVCQPVVVRQPGVEKVIRCKKCPFITAHSVRMATHYKMHNLKEDYVDAKVYHCEECNYMIDHVGPFRLHLEAHNNEQKYFCPLKFCLFRSNRQFSVKRHMLARHGIPLQWHKK